MTCRPNRRLGALAGAGLVVLTALSGCSLGEKQEQADLVIAAAQTTATRDHISGVLSVSLDVQLEQEIPGFSLDAFTGGLDAEYVIDNGAGVSQLLAAAPPVPGAEEAPRLIVLHGGDRIRALRPNAQPDDARPWLELRLADLERGSGELTAESLESGGAAAGILAVLDPRFLLDLAAGPLAGSIEQLADEEINGQPAAHFKANFDIDTVLDDTRDDAYSDDREEQQRLLLDLVKITRDVHPGEAWLSADGRLVQFAITLQIDIERMVQFDLDVTLTLDDPAAGELVKAPGRDQTVLIDSLVPIERAAASIVPDPLAGVLGGG